MSSAVHVTVHALLDEPLRGTHLNCPAAGASVTAGQLCVETGKGRRAAGPSEHSRRLDLGRVVLVGTLIGFCGRLRHVRAGASRICGC